MEPWLRTLLLISGLVFCGVFGVLTLTVAIESGLDILVLVSLIILGLIASGLVSAMREQDDE